MPTASADGTLYNVAPADGGLGTLFAPDNLEKIKRLQAQNAFSDGLPTDANGNTDWMSAAKTLYQKGDFGDASQMMQTGIAQQQLRAAATPSDVLAPTAGSPAATPAAPGSAATPTVGAVKGANPDVVSYIRAKAPTYGINPNAALSVAAREGMIGFDPNGNANLGDGGSSAGPFQLHYGGVAGGGNAVSGLGDDFTAATKLDARDPSTWKDQVDFALAHAAKNGWGAFHGAAKAGIPEWAGISGAPTSASLAPDGAPATPNIQLSANDATTTTDAAPVTGVHPYGAAPPAPTPPASGTGNSWTPPAGAADGTSVPSPASAPAPTGPSTTYASNGSNFVDPTLGGLVSTDQLQKYGSYGGIAKAAAAEAAALGNNPYGKEKATVLLDYAKQIMTTVAKANELTSEQKNARDPLVNSQQTNLAVTRAKARADATADNALVPVAQADGSTALIPKKVALTQAAAGNPLVKSLPGYVTSGQQNLLTKLNDGSTAYGERQIAGERLDALSDLLSTYQTGANSTAFNDAAAKLRSFGISIPNSATLNPAAMQEFTKNAYANVLSSMREQGNKQFVSEVQSAINSNPNSDLQPEANAAMVAQMKAIQQYHDQNFRDYTDWYNGNKGASNDAQFQIGWAKANPLSTYVTAARKDIAPLGAALPPKGQLVDGQAYMVRGQKARWSASAGGFVPIAAGP